MVGKRLGKPRAKVKCLSIKLQYRAITILQYFDKHFGNVTWYYLGEYFCTRFGCDWDGYTSNTDWGYYHKPTNNSEVIVPIEQCQMQCSDDPNCGSFEWTTQYCSWWKTGVCQHISDSTMTDTHFLMCRKQSTYYHLFLFFCIQIITINFYISDIY